MATTKKSTTKKSTAASKKAAAPAATIEDVLSALAELSAVINEGFANIATAGADVDDDEDEDDEEEVELTQEMVDEALAAGIKDLRELAASVGIETTKKAEILAEFAELLGDEDDDEDEDEEDEDEEEADEDDEDEDEEDDEDEEWDVDALKEMSLKDLRALAKSEEGGEHSAADVKGLDQDALIELITGEEADEDEEEDEDEEDEEEEEVLDEDALKAMSHKELLAVAKELELKVPAKVKSPANAKTKKALVALILDSGDDE